MEDFIINHFFLICKLIIYTGVGILIYSVEKKGRNKESKKESKKENNTIISNNISSKKNIGRDIGVVVTLIGIVLFIIGIVAICIGIYFIIQIGILFSHFG